MNELRKEKLAADIEALQENELFVQTVLTAGSIENIVRVLEGYGIESTAEEIRELAREGAAVLSPSEDELSLEDLEMVAGGGKWRGRLRFATALLGGAVVGFGCGVLTAGTCGLGSSAGAVIAVGYTTVATVWVVDGYAKKGW